MLAVRTFAVTALLLLFGCSSGDISVKSDVGEKYLVKEASVDVTDFPTSGVLKTLRDSVRNITNLRDNQVSDCLKTHPSLGKTGCLEISAQFEDTFTSQISKEQNRIQVLETLPVTRLVTFRTVNTDVNGDKSASDYWNVACIPDGTQEERKKWSEVLIEVLDDTKEDYKTNLADDGSVAASVRKKVCEKYGQSS